jgi:hypothetical protein
VEKSSPKAATKVATAPAGKRGERGQRLVAVREPSGPAGGARGKIVLFPFQGDGGGAVARQVGRTLRGKGLKVATNIRPVDSAEQYREMGAALNVAAYIHGEVNGDGDESRATVHVRSGVSGQRIASASFSTERRKLPGEISKTLWGRVGSDLVRVCAQASKPRKVRAMRIAAGTPLADPPREEEASEEARNERPSSQDPWAGE